ncbi:nitrite reductase small subunit NirD [Paenibacillus sp. MMS18-CY102]|uniref:nitrite reductase small subunit NirD n=1 Tax=Paenibacillus sp. MMS18-CY102 TaxID=2682849 RepID=UPI00136568A1|nr:nitrite reductase small subunit NirD [Paenibacillus sp. MMS18-CY102]MWC29898.1 nitrite reductase small subunit NirD [Paenibacillus sp. MMS18-CY102]
MAIQDQRDDVEIGRIDDFPQGLGRQVRIGMADLAVFHTTSGDVYALENRTPHRKGGTLAEAIVSGHYIYCPLRDLKINLKDGMVQAPDTGQVRTFHAKVEAGAVYVERAGQHAALSELELTDSRSGGR